MPKAKAKGLKKGVAPLPALRRSIRSARAPTRLVEEPAVDSQDDAPADTPADTPVVVGLRQQVEQLQAQLLASATLPAAPGSPVASSSRGWEETVPVAEPTLLLPPAVQPPAQDLLANALRQMTAPPATGEHLGVTTDIAQFFVLGATLDPKVKAKIREGAYVELGSLSSPTGSSVSVSMGTDGQPSIALTSVRARPPATILEWIRLFTTYASVYVETHPDEAPSLFSYVTVITDLQTRHGGFAWRVYDERFRRVRAMAPQMPWHITNWDLAMGAIQSNVPFVRQGAPPTQSPFHNGRRPDARGLCNDFNYRGKCARQQCRFAHVCNVCGRSGHSGRTCRSAQPAPRKGRAGFAVAGARPPP